MRNYWSINTIDDCAKKAYHGIEWMFYRGSCTLAVRSMLFVRFWRRLLRFNFFLETNTNTNTCRFLLVKTTSVFAVLTFSGGPSPVIAAAVGLHAV